MDEGGRTTILITILNKLSKGVLKNSALAEFGLGE